MASSLPQSLSRVLVRSQPCVFGTSIFDSIITADNTIQQRSNYVAGSSINNTGGGNGDVIPDPATTSLIQACRHYDRTLVWIQPFQKETMPQPDSSTSNDTTRSLTGVQLWGPTCYPGTESPPSSYCSSSTSSSSFTPCILPMGRARDFPPMGSNHCPTTVTETQRATETRKQQQLQCQEQINNEELLMGKYRHHPQLAVVAIVKEEDEDKEEMKDNNQHSHESRRQGPSRILLTRRPSYMRSFPGAWVLPGGGVDPAENLVTAVVREVLEETGLSVTTTTTTTTTKSPPDANPSETIQPIAIWESVYPTIPQPNVAITAHHLVVYFLCEARSRHHYHHHELQQKQRNGGDTLRGLVSAAPLNLCAEEVDCAVWLTPQEVEYILQASSQRDNITTQGQAEEAPSSTTMITAYMADGTLQELPLDQLVGIYPQRQPSKQQEENDPSLHHIEDDDDDDDDDVPMLCGMAQGSLFALEELVLSPRWWGRRTTTYLSSTSKL